MSKIKTHEEAFTELHIAASNVKREFLKGCWIFRIVCRLFRLEEALDKIIENEL